MRHIYSRIFGMALVMLGLLFAQPTFALDITINEDESVVVYNDARVVLDVEDIDDQYTQTEERLRTFLDSLDRDVRITLSSDGEGIDRFQVPAEILQLDPPQLVADFGPIDVRFNGHTDYAIHIWEIGEILDDDVENNRIERKLDLTQVTTRDFDLSYAADRSSITDIKQDIFIQSNLSRRDIRYPQLFQVTFVWKDGNGNAVTEPVLRNVSIGTPGVNVPQNMFLAQFTVPRPDNATQYTIVIDPNQALAETNEINNEVSMDYHGAVVHVPADLRISNEETEIGELFQTVAIDDAGGTNVDAFQVTFAWEEENGDLFGDFITGQTAYRQDGQWYADFSIERPDNAVAYVISLDTLFQVEETNEQNNQERRLIEAVSAGFFDRIVGLFNRNRQVTPRVLENQLLPTGDILQEEEPEAPVSTVLSQEAQDIIQARADRHKVNLQIAEVRSITQNDWESLQVIVENQFPLTEEQLALVPESIRVDVAIINAYGDVSYRILEPAPEGSAKYEELFVRNAHRQWDPETGRVWWESERFGIFHHVLPWERTNFTYDPDCYARPREHMACMLMQGIRARILPMEGFTIDNPSDNTYHELFWPDLTPERIQIQFGSSLDLIVRNSNPGRTALTWLPSPTTGFVRLYDERGSLIGIGHFELTNDQVAAPQTEHGLRATKWVHFRSDGTRDVNAQLTDILPDAVAYSMEINPGSEIEENGHIVYKYNLKEGDYSNNTLGPIPLAGHAGVAMVMVDEASYQDQDSDDYDAPAGGFGRFFASIRRGVQRLFTFGDENKQKVALQHRYELLEEMEVLAEQGEYNALRARLAAFKKETQRLKDKQAFEVEAIAGKMLEQDVVYHIFLEKVAEEAAEKGETLEEEKNIALGTLVQTAEKLAEKGRLDKAIKQVFEKGGSPYKPVKNIAILKTIEKSAPKEVQQVVKENIKEQEDALEEVLEKGTEETKTAFAEYVKTVSAKPEEKEAVIMTAKKVIKEETVKTLLDFVAKEKIQAETKADILRDEVEDVKETLDDLQVSEKDVLDKGLDAIDTEPIAKPLDKIDTEPIAKPLDQIDTEPIAKPDIEKPAEDTIFCTEEYAPVCANGKTFANECKAKVAGATSWEKGDCDEIKKELLEVEKELEELAKEIDAPCDKTGPVCGIDGVTYDSGCAADAVNMVYAPGACSASPLLPLLTPPKDDKPVITLHPDGPEPEAIIVAPGTVIRVWNKDNVPHAIDSSQKTPEIAVGGTLLLGAPTQPGTYTYYGTGRDGYAGKIIVK